MGKILNSNRRYYPSKVFGIMCITAVLVEGAIEDYAVYVGHGDDEYVARQGDKLRFTEAKVQFPNIEEKRYRL